MKNYFVSVLITNYNKGKFLKNSITSVLNQTYKNKEVLLFDDCSKDDSLKILSKYRNIKIIRNKNKKYKSGPLNQIYGLEKLYRYIGINWLNHLTLLVITSLCIIF